MKFHIYLFLFAVLIILSCQNNESEKKENTTENNLQYESLDLSKEFKQHWFDGNAEVASYDLTQMRYGEARQGSAVLIFVKEPFLPQAQVKANTASDETIDVMKLNYTKKFNTGIYPYSIMQSVFYPLTTQPHALKVAASTQEWCGQTYMQLNNLNNNENFKIKSHSYFEGEADQELELEKHLLENELWVMLRINPRDIPQGQMQVIPDLSYFRLKHKSTKAYRAEINQSAVNDTLVTTLDYRDLDRTLKIYQDQKFPYTILKWEEIDGGENEKMTQAVLQKSIRIDYWNKNSNNFLHLRDSLKLD